MVFVVPSGVRKTPKYHVPLDHFRMGIWSMGSVLDKVIFMSVEVRYTGHKIPSLLGCQLAIILQHLEGFSALPVTLMSRFHQRSCDCAC